MKASLSNLSLDKGLSASPIPWRDASMEVLVSPNDGPMIAIEDLELDSPTISDSPLTDELLYEFDTTSMYENDIPNGRGLVRLKSDSSNSPSIPGIDKLLDRKFACYGVSPRLTRKVPDIKDIASLASNTPQSHSPNSSASQQVNGLSAQVLEKGQG